MPSCHVNMCHALMHASKVLRRMLHLISELHRQCVDVAHNSHIVDLRVEVAVVDGFPQIHKVGVKVQRQHLHWRYYTERSENLVFWS